ncbi:MAG: DUF1501 domain-containing protein [Armatimonadetes bacterium]|nr:DUF1501 domain-containing protein [Armatimonadota bacterium]MBS1701092.1 DUF1501 domain-containing protein [Armatimonadota bacterium]MBS1727891.1 DUF1501 domain-containing protein [Armatimonadota bacterium]
MSDFLSRRDLMKHGGVIAIGLAAPKWLSTIAEADVLRVAKGGKPASDTVLVVCQLSGGNDGLNTVIPYADSLYYKYRPTIGHKDDVVLKLNETLGLHPAMKGMQTLYKEGKVAVITNVGYPKPNRSHFKSMDIWQSASPDDKMKHGWIGRHFDSELKKEKLNPIVALGLSTEKPLALVGDSASIPCFASLTDVQNMLGDASSEQLLREIQGTDAMMGSPTRVVQQANKSALDAMSVLSKQLGTFTPKQTYGDDAFGKGFKQISQLIGASPATRVVYFSAGGFDTHSRQLDTHARLLGNFSDAVLAFQREMESINRADKVIILVFSEFGRRVSENASQGTDHGAAAPMFVIGGKVKGGIHGTTPDLSDLQDGDVRFKTDFRQVYAATLDNWIGGDSEVVLGQKFDDLPLFA